MKDKEKQIEEMFQDVAKVMCDCEDKERFFRPRRYECRKCCMHTVIQHIVFFLRNSDYQKLNEVVLTLEELNTIKKNEYLRGKTQQCWDIQKKARKETAKRDFNTIIKALEERKDRVKAFYGVAESVGADIAIRTVKELAKQLGVEIEENIND